MNLDQHLSRIIDEINHIVNAKDFKADGMDTDAPESINIDGSIHGLRWDFDPEVGEQFVTVGFTLPSRVSGFVFPEIDGDTYGELQGFRVYYEAL